MELRDRPLRRFLLSKSKLPNHIENVPGLFFFRVAAMMAAVATVSYLVWRVRAQTIPWSLPLPRIFFICECVSGANLLYFVILLWTRIRRKPLRLSELHPPFPELDFPSVDVFIPTLNEPIEVISETVLAAVRARYPNDKKRVYLLDDGMREEVRLWLKKESETHSCLRYLARPKEPGVPDYAKAGNLNYALFHPETSGELILLLDADHVCKENIFESLVPGFYEFDDKGGRYQLNRVAYFQAPDCSWSKLEGNPLADDTRPFHTIGQQANDALNAVWLVGTSVMIRRDALLDIGGFFKHSVTEDVPTGFLMLEKGWKSGFHSEPVTTGMPPVSMEAMLKQRQRWTQGDLQQYSKILFRVLPRLSWKQRISYLQGPVNTITRFFVLGLIFIPPLCIIFRQPVMIISMVDFAYVVLPYLAVLRIFRLFAWKDVGPRAYFRTEQLYFCSTGSFLSAVVRFCLRPSQIRFWVSPKRRTSRKGILVPLTAVLLTAPVIWACKMLLSDFSSSPFLLMPWYVKVSLVWCVNTVLCLLPLFYYSVFRPRLSSRYFEETEETESQWSTGVRWLILPTNFALVASMAVVVWDLLILSH